MTLVIQILLSFILSHANPQKEQARNYLKEQLSGWQETVALALFDAAWEAALAAAGGRFGTLSTEHANLIASCSISANKAVTSELS